MYVNRKWKESYLSLNGALKFLFLKVGLRKNEYLSLNM
jgi:hypothetical protein